MIYRKMRQVNQKRQQLSKKEKREVQLTKILFFIVIMYLLCNVMEATMRISYFSFGLIIIDCRIYHTSDFLLTVNSSINFIIYVMLGKKFQDVLVSMICKNRELDISSVEILKQTAQ